MSKDFKANNKKPINKVEPIDTNTVVETKESKIKKLVSNLPYPIVLKYNNEDMVISPRATVKKINVDLINEVLPSGLTLVDE